MQAAAAPDAPRRIPRYRGFISYSHAADDRLAPALQSGLQRFAKPWYRFRAMRVFRDKTGLAVTPGLWGSIQKALADSDYFILLASPQAAQSKWVEQEVDWWLRNRPADHLLIVVTDGELAWDPGTGDFDWTKTTALPHRLAKAFTGEPKYLDLRAIRTGVNLSLREPRFLEAIAGLSATLQARPLDDLIGEDLDQHRKTIRLLRFAVAGLAILTVTAGVAAYLAFESRKVAGELVRARDDAADAAQREAASRQIAERSLAALGSDPELAILLASEAVTIRPTAEAVSALRRSLSGELPPKSTWQAHAGGAYFADFTRDGQRLITGGADKTARVWNAGSGKLGFELHGHTDGVTGSDTTPDGTRICTFSRYDQTARFWDAADGRSLFTIQPDRMGSAVLSPDGRYALTVSDTGELALWDATSGRRVRRLRDSGREVTSVRFSPDGGRVAVLDLDPSVSDVATGKVLFKLEEHTKQVRDIDYSPDGQWIVTASADHTARLWRAANGTSAAVLPHELEVVFAMFSPGGQWIVTGDEERVLRVWDPTSRSRVSEIDVRPMTLSHFAVSPDGNLLVAVLEEGAAQIFEARTGVKVAELTGIDSPVLSISFSPESQRIATAALNGNVSLYEVRLGGTTEQLLALARERVARQLSAQERAQYLPDGFREGVTAPAAKAP